MQDVVCNEPIMPLAMPRSPRVWLTMLNPDLPGKLVRIQVQLNHGLVEEEKPRLDDQLLALYTAVIQKFARLHGDATRCFLVRAPESIELAGLHVQEFGGPTNGIACLETVFCVSARDDGKLAISHVDERFAPAEFELLAGLPKNRVLAWRAHARQASAGGAASWAAVIHRAVQYHVNRHKGPTGQIELNIPGLNIVAGSVLPGGCDTHSDSTLTAAGLIASMTAAGEWGRVPLADFAEWCADAECAGTGRKSNLGPLLFGMPNEVLHMDWNPARGKSHALAAGHVFICAHSGLPAAPNFAHGRLRATTTHIGFALFRQCVCEALARPGSPRDATLNDEFVYQLLRQIPERATRGQTLEALKSTETQSALQAHFATHDEPPGGYCVREKLLFVLAEMQRAARAANAIRRGDAAELGAYMNIGQAGEASLFHELTPGGLVEQTRQIIHCSGDGELLAMAGHVEALWKQTGRSGASTPETDLLCDLAAGVNGVLGARYCEPQRAAVLCKREALSAVLDRLTAGYYTPRHLPPTLAQQVFPCRGAGVLAI